MAMAKELIVNDNVLKLNFLNERDRIITTGWGGGGLVLTVNQQHKKGVRDAICSRVRGVSGMTRRSRRGGGR